MYIKRHNNKVLNMIPVRSSDQRKDTSDQRKDTSIHRLTLTLLERKEDIPEKDISKLEFCPYCGGTPKLINIGFAKAAIASVLITPP